MRRLLAVLPIAGLLVFGFALTAQAHSFTGTGDCDGWTLQLDGTWNAYDITVDGSSIGLAQTVDIPDSSDATSRTFVVRWWKQGPDVTRTVTVERTLDCDTTTTTEQPSSTTTTIGDDSTTSTSLPVEESTTTTSTESTTSSLASTTTAPSESTTTTADSSTTSTGPVSSSSAPPPELPRTGAATEALVAIAAALSVLGFMVVKEAGRE